MAPMFNIHLSLKPIPTSPTLLYRHSHRVTSIHQIAVLLYRGRRRHPNIINRHLASGELYPGWIEVTKMANLILHFLQTSQMLPRIPGTRQLQR